MARTVERIEKDLAALEENLGAIAQEFEEVYTGYLNDLGEAVSRQLILVVYQLCTQEYPQSFLALSLQQRQDLQQTIRQLAQSGTQRLLALLQEPLPTEEEEEEEEDEDEEAGPLETAAESMDPDSDQEQANEPIPTLTATEAEEMMVLLALQASAAAGSSEAVDMDDPLNRLAAWQQRIESGIGEVLLRLSNGANRTLHHAHILPHQLPEPVLEVATKSAMMTEPTPGSPNLINLVIEAKSEEAKSSDVMRLVAIRLRLAEVEFANPSLSNWRSRLRAIQGRLSQVGKAYRKNQRERAIAEAELAWRSSWYED